MFSGVQKTTNGVRFGFAMLLVAALALAAPFSAAAAGPGGNAGTDVSPQVIVRAANIVSRITLSPRSPNVLLIRQPITINYNYNTTSGAGVIVKVVAFTGTTPTANATTCKSRVLAVGHGTATCVLSVTAAPARITAFRFQMWNNTLTTMLFQSKLPVNYAISKAPNLVSSVTTTPAAPGIQILGKGVSVKFNYRTNHGGGVRIVAIPYTGPNPTANYATCASPLYAIGSGTGTCRFVVNTAAANVTSVVIQMWDATQTTMLTQFSLPFAFRYRSNATMLTRASLSPASPNIVRLGDKVYVHFNYQTNQAGGIVVEATPFTGASPTANAAVTPSAVLPTGSGIGSCFFQIMAGTIVTSDSVRFQVFDATHTNVLFTVIYPVQYQFR